MGEDHPPNHPTRNLNDGLVYRVATRGTEPKEGKRAVPIKITGAMEEKHARQGKARPGHLDGTTGTFETGLSVFPVSVVPFSTQSRIRSGTQGPFSKNQG